MAFRDFKIAVKQIIGFGLILTFLAGLNIYTFFKLFSLKNDLDEVSKSWFPRAIAVSDIKANTLELRLNQLQYLQSPELWQQELLRQDMALLIDSINENLDPYETAKSAAEDQHLFSERERVLFEEFSENWETYLDYSFKFFRLADKNQNEAANQLLNAEVQDAYSRLSEALNKIVGLQEQNSSRAANQAALTVQSTGRILRLLLIITIGFSILLVIALARYISVPIERLVEAAQEVAGGNLDVQLKVESKDEIGKLSASFNQMTLSLQTAMDKTRKQSERLQAQQLVLQERNVELAEKSESLEKQKQQTEAQNKALAEALDELQNAQKQLLLKEKMASLGNLVAGVAHEINNPIGTVISSMDVASRCLDRIERLCENHNGQDSAYLHELTRITKLLRDNIRVADTAGGRIVELVKSLRSFARLDQSEFQKVDIHNGLESSITILGTETLQNIRINRKYDPKLPAIFCWPGQLNQVFFNVLKNAAEAISGSGEINITTGSHENGIQVEISDSGQGIPPERLNTLFDFGFSTGQSRVRLSSGLAIAYSIIERHKGNIRLESKPAVGTTVTIELPLSPAQDGVRK